MAKGHTLVVPKQETDYIFDLNDNLLAEMIVFASCYRNKNRNPVQ